MESSQRALHIAVLILGNGAACGVGELQRKCCLFPVSSVELLDLCALQDSPLQVVEDNKIGLAVNFLVELRSHLDNFGGTCNKAPRGDDTNFLVPALPSASIVVPPVQDGVVQDLEVKEKSPLPKRIPEFQDYIVLGEEGSGGYGTVYRVRRKRDDQLFAIKCPLEKTTPDHVNHEIKMLQRLGGQEYIIRCEEVVWEVLSLDMEEKLKENQRPNLVLRYVDHDKPEVLRKEITVHELQLYGYCLFKALAFLHKQGIVHRDVKPGNFLFSRKRGTGFLVDFNLALVTASPAVASGKCRRTCSKALKDSAKGEANKEPSRVILGKRVRKEVAFLPPKRHQTSNIRGNQAGYHYSDISPQADIVSRDLDRGPDSPSKSGHPSAAVECVVQTTLNPKIKGGATATPGEERSEKSAAVDSSSKVPIVCNPVDPTQKPRQIRRSLRPVTVSKEPDEGPPQSALGDLAWMPQTAGVLRFAQYHKNRNLTQQTSVSSPKPPASQRKRVAATQVARVRPPISPPQRSTKVSGAGIHRHMPFAKDGPCAGTKGYRAPEVLLKSSVQTSKLDIWSAGVSLLQLVAGKAPFPSSSSEQALRDIAKLRGVDGLLKLAGEHDCLHKLPPDFEALNCKPMSVSNWCSTYGKRTEMRDRVPPELCDLLEKCLQVDPNQRIDAADALSHDFFKSVEARVTPDDGLTTRAF